MEIDHSILKCLLSRLVLDWFLIVNQILFSDCRCHTSTLYKHPSTALSYYDFLNGMYKFVIENGKTGIKLS